MTADAATSLVKKIRQFIHRALCERADRHLGVALVSSEYFETGFEERLHLGVFDIRDESCLDKIVLCLMIGEFVRRIAFSNVAPRIRLISSTSSIEPSVN